MLISQLKLAALILTTAMILSGVALLGTQTGAQTREGDPRPSPQAQAVAPPSPRNPLPTQTRTPVIPAPEEVKVAAGRAKALLYVLDADGYRMDQDGRRMPNRPADAQRPAKEIALEIRWAVATGTVNHRATQASFSNGGKVAPPPLEAMYRRVELERQSQQAAGAWSDWRLVDAGPTVSNPGQSAGSGPRTKVP